MRKLVRVLVGLALLWPATGCRVPEPGVMVSIAPPPTWAADLERSRRAKDEHFRNGVDTPLLEEDVESFSGLEYWDPDRGLYFVGPINRYPSPERMTLLTTAGKQRPGERYGWLTFTIDGQPNTLQVYRMLDNDVSGTQALFLPFQDGTSGKETYPAGRYVNLQGEPGGPYVLDFNRAHNPYCAYGAPERFACPVTPAENRLTVRIEAGERGFKEPPARP